MGFSALILSDLATVIETKENTVQTSQVSDSFVGRVAKNNS